MIIFKNCDIMIINLLKALTKSLHTLLTIMSAEVKYLYICIILTFVNISVNSFMRDQKKLNIYCILNIIIDILNIFIFIKF